MTERTVVERLAGHLTDGVEGLLVEEVRAWLTASPRFRAFADAHRDKIRKKMRGAAENTEALRDVRVELRVAYLLLADRRIELAFEAYGARAGGPDFTIRYRGDPPFNLEVTRQRRPPGQIRDGGPLLAKLRQLPPSIPNLLVVALEAANAAELDVAQAVAALRRRADAKEDGFFIRRRLAGARDFHTRFLRLGGVIAWSDAAAGGARAHLWTNPSARIAPSERAVRACVACLSEGG